MEATTRPKKTAAGFEQHLIDRKISMREYARKPQRVQKQLREEYFGHIDSVAVADAIIQERTGKTVAVRIDEDQGCGVYLGWLKREYPGLIVTMADHDRQPREWQQEASRKFVDRLLPKATAPNEGFRASTSSRPVSLVSKKEFVATAAGARAAEKRAAAAREARGYLDSLDPVSLIKRLPAWVRCVLGLAILVAMAWYAVAWGKGK